ncbi:MAG: MotA/TolQ/ExbB proton channel family protein [Synergistaceae bacterium]|jgi:biopolymer transport protein ExbB|nr:MotA/TolQ/ExbB proton channel family protein [Synergistaceae bacterium]
MSFMEYMRSGGDIMWIILVLSVAGLALVIERTIFFIVSSTDPRVLESEFARALSKGDAAALNSSVSGRSSMHRIFSAAYSSWSADGETMRLILEQQVRREIYRWEKNLSLLGIIAKVSPLLGLLGTVLGMVQMFQSMNLGGAVNSAAVTGGIWKALFTTVAGLAVAIPVIIAHGILTGMIDSAEETMRRGADFIMMEHSGRGSWNSR